MLVFYACFFALFGVCVVVQEGLRKESGCVQKRAGLFFFVFCVFLCFVDLLMCVFCPIVYVLLVFF